MDPDRNSVQNPVINVSGALVWTPFVQTNMFLEKHMFLEKLALFLNACSLEKTVFLIISPVSKRSQLPQGPFFSEK